jgi:hypothetical protein
MSSHNFCVPWSRENREEKIISNLITLLKMLKKKEEEYKEKMSKFSKESLVEMMLFVSGSSTPLDSQLFTEMNQIFAELKQIRDALSLIQEIDRKQKNNEPLTKVEKIFNEYFHMVSELSTTCTSLVNIRDINKQNNIYDINDRDLFKVKMYFETRASALESWFRYKWTTEFLSGSGKRKQQMNNRSFNDPERVTKMSKLLEEREEFYKLNRPENSRLTSIYSELVEDMKSLQQKLNSPELKSKYLLKLEDILSFLNLSEEEKESKILDLKADFDQLMPEINKFSDRYTSFVVDCRVQTRKHRQQMEETDDGVLDLYQFCINCNLPFPGIQNEGDEVIPIPLKGERTYEKMKAYYDMRESKEPSWRR